MTTRIAICQPSLPAYRVPVFEQLALTPGIELSLFADLSDDLTDRSVTLPCKVISSPHHPVPLLGGRLFSQSNWKDVVRPNRFDLVILPWNIRYANLVPTLLRARRARVPVVLWGHGYSKQPQLFTDWARNRVGRLATAVLVYTRTVAENLIHKAGFEKERVGVAQNAIDQRPIRQARDHWLNHPHELNAFRQEHGLDPDQTLIFVSRLLAENRIDLLLEAFRRLHSARPRTRLVIVGGGPDAPRLRGIVEAAGLADQVRMPGPIYDEQTLAPWMLSATLFAYPVNIGLSLMQAFGYGLPTVTSDAVENQNPEIEALQNGVNGLLYKDGDLDDMIRCWCRILDDSATRQAMSREAFRTVTEKYSLDNMVAGFLDLLRFVRKHQP